MRLAAPTPEEVLAALVECGEEDVLEGEEITPNDFSPLDDAAQHTAKIRDDADGVLKSLYEFARLPAYADTKVLACTEWG